MNSLRLVRAYIQGSTSFSKGGIKELRRQDRLWVLPLALLGVAVGGVSFMGMLLANYQSLFALGLSAGNPELVVFAALLAAWILQFVLGIPLVLAVLFFSKDNTLLMTLPVRPMDIVLSKALYIMGILLPMQLFFFLPGVIIYAQGMEAVAAAGGVGITSWPLFWGSTLLYGLAGPLVPMALAMLAVSLLIRLVNITRHKTAVELMGLFLTLVTIIGMQLLLTRSMTGGDGEVADPQALAGLARILTDNLYSALPPITWAARGFSAPLSFLSGLLFIAGVSAGGLFLVQALYLRSLSRHREGGGGRRIQPTEPPALESHSPGTGPGKNTSPWEHGAAPSGSAILRPRSPVTALVSREWKVLSSQSTFLFEGMAQVAIFPLMLLILGITMPADFLEMIPQMGIDPGLLNLILFGAIILMLCLNSVAPTSLSREGRLFALNTILPVQANHQVLAKLLFHYILFLPALVLDLILAVILLGMQPLSLFWALPGGLGLVTLFFSLGLSLDLRRPLLTWTNPQQAMKQNMNVLLAMGLDVLILGIVAAILYGLYSLGVSWILIGVILSLLSLAAGAGSYLWVSHAARGRYSDEVAA